MNQYVYRMLIQFICQYPSTNRTNLNMHPSHHCSRIKTRQVNLIHLDETKGLRRKLRHKLQRSYPLMNRRELNREYNPLRQVSVKHRQVLSALFPRPPQIFPLLPRNLRNSAPRARSRSRSRKISWKNKFSKTDPFTVKVHPSSYRVIQRGLFEGKENRRGDTFACEFFVDDRVDPLDDAMPVDKIVKY